MLSPALETLAVTCGRPCASSEPAIQDGENLRVMAKQAVKQAGLVTLR